MFRVQRLSGMVVDYNEFEKEDKLLKSEREGNDECVIFLVS